MNKVILTLAVVSFSLLNAQKKEINAAVKAVDNNDITTAQNQINAAESIINGKFEYLEPELYEGYNYAKGIVLLKSNNIVEAASHFGKVAELKDNKIFTGRDSDRKKVFFVGKKAAESSGISDLKEEKHETEKLNTILAIVDPIIQQENTKAINEYNSKNYGLAAIKFRETFELLKAFGRINGQLLYNSALSDVSANNNLKAINSFKELINIGYTGIQTTYTAKENETGDVHVLDKTAWDLLKKNPKYSDFKQETSKSIEFEIYETYLRLLDEEKKHDEALAFLEIANKKFPNNSKLLEIQSNIYYKSNKTEEFEDSLKKQLSQKPTDAVSWYNYAVIKSKDPNSEKEAISAYKKAIELNPKMNNAYLNLVYVLLGDDSKAVESYNKLRKSGDIDGANKVMDSRRERFKSALPYAEKLYELDPNNIDTVSLLRGMYQTTRNEAKRKEFKEKEDFLLKK